MAVQSVGLKLRWWYCPLCPRQPKKKDIGLNLGHTKKKFIVSWFSNKVKLSHIYIKIKWKFEHHIYTIAIGSIIMVQKCETVSHVSETWNEPLITSGSYTLIWFTYCERARCIYLRQLIIIPKTQCEMQLCPMLCLKLIFSTCVVCWFGYQ